MDYFSSSANRNQVFSSLQINKSPFHTGLFWGQLTETMGTFPILSQCGRHQKTSSLLHFSSRTGIFTSQLLARKNSRGPFFRDGKCSVESESRKKWFSKTYIWPAAMPPHALCAYLIHAHTAGKVTTTHECYT